MTTLARRTLFVLGSLCALAGTATEAHAEGCEQVSDTASAYNQAFDAAIEAYQASDWAGALAALDEAEAICAVNPQLTYQRGRVLHKQTDCAAALPLYEKARVQIDAGIIVVSESLAGKVDQRIGECSVASLAVTCADPDVALTLDDAAPVACPHTWDGLAPGAHTLIATRDGALAPWREALVVEPASAAAVAVPEIVLAPTEAPEPEPKPIPQPIAAVEPDYTLTWIGVATSVLGAGGVVAGTLLMTTAIDDADEVNGIDFTQVDGHAELDDAEDLWLTGAIVTGVGGAILAAGITLIVVDIVQNGNLDETPAASVGLAPNGASFTLRF